MDMISFQFLFRRFVSLLVVLWLIITIVFIMFRMVPGDVTDLIVDPLASPELKERLRAELGLDEPLTVQYVLYLGDLLQGNLGQSFYYQQPVSELVRKAIVRSIPLVFWTFVFAYGLGGLTGIILGWKRGTRLERVVSSMILLIRGAPPFWLGLLFISLFANVLGWLPEGGLGGEIAQRSAFDLWFSMEFARHLILPALTGGLAALALPTLLMRATMLDVLHEDFVDLARAKGLKEHLVIFLHAAQNALLPMVAQSGTFIGWAVGGLVAIEVVFAWPGLGRLIVQALLSRDYPLAQGAFIAIALIVVSLYLIVDLIIAWLDPRTDIA